MVVMVGHMILVRCILVFFFKQKTAYEMRISDWSSDVCSSDLARKNWKRKGLECDVERHSRGRSITFPVCRAPGSPSVQQVQGRMCRAGCPGRAGDRLRRPVQRNPGESTIISR